MTFRGPVLAAALLALAAGACKKDETCPIGTARCGSSCVDPLTDPANCGNCGVACGTGAVCCAGSCTDTATDPLHCGGCSQACFVGAQCTGGVCGACPVALPDPCPPTGPPGTCVNLQTGVGGYCGTCGLACAGTGVAAADATCTSGACVCSGAATDCGANPRCVNLLVDMSNCGACLAPCTGTNRTCAGGLCVCATGFTECGGACVNTATDEANCGTCGYACATGATCSTGLCACPGAEVVCGTSPGACVDTTSDAANCGTCGHACTTGVPCRSSVCCSATLPLCGGTCCAGGSACCGDACPTEHQNGLGQVFFDCNPRGTYTHDSALSAADAWTTTGTTYDGTTLCGASCIGRQTTTTCAVWCWAGGWQGQVALGSTLVCQCPGATGAVTATWN